MDNGATNHITTDLANLHNKVEYGGSDRLIEKRQVWTLIILVDLLLKFLPSILN